MSESLTETIQEERDFDLPQVVEEVGGYAIGGIIGGVTFQLMLLDPPFLKTIIAILAIVGGGTVLTWIIKMGPVIGRAVARWRSSE